MRYTWIPPLGNQKTKAKTRPMNPAAGKGINKPQQYQWILVRAGGPAVENRLCVSSGRKTAYLYPAVGRPLICGAGKGGAPKPLRSTNGSWCGKGGAQKAPSTVPMDPGAGKGGGQKAPPQHQWILVRERGEPQSPSTVPMDPGAGKAVKKPHGAGKGVKHPQQYQWILVRDRGSSGGRPLMCVQR